jgi:hypothetical protein
MTTKALKERRASNLWLLVPIILLCLPAAYLGILWIGFQLLGESRMPNGQNFYIWIFIAYLPVAGFGIYMEGLALIFWLVLVFRKGQIHLKAIASVLLLLAWLGTSKAAWVIGFRN